MIEPKIIVNKGIFIKKFDFVMNKLCNYKKEKKGKHYESIKYI